MLLISIISCSATKQLNNKWIGKTDADVVKEFGMPDSVGGFIDNGKTYYYFFSSKTVTKSFSYDSYKIGSYEEGFKSPILYNESHTFFFDSLNKVINCILLDTTYKSKGNYFIKKK